MTLTYDLYWSFRSPYSYLITHKLVELERDYDVHGAIRPVYPLAVRTPEFFDGRDPLWYSYLQLGHPPRSRVPGAAHPLAAA